ncbi:MAG: methyltransferase domain-containing protein [Nitrospinaceae bacterium]|jgi:tRNA (cmo5U34)-methyltransferase|nr:methyltransferase [Rhodospirillaceae bacterium]MDP6478391.1 methyltransferase domain-containing protein [Nitrospinaceae bacterium]|tara:strand:+ start:4959 stop:5669 length:711 start_codon:yes stop_codon:yes gene_type:complete
MKVGDGITIGRANWDFGGNTPDHFVEHIAKSVPFYAEGHELICYLSDYFILRDSTCYELGVSTGELIKKLAGYNQHKPETKWIGIDNEEKMIKKAREHCSEVDNIELHHEDVLLFSYEKADMIVSYYTIQFIPERHRQDLFNKIYERLNWGGAFVFFEKVRGPDARFHDIVTSLYHDFKLRNGFSPEEIINKAQSLKGAMKPFTPQGNLDLLKRAGFVDMMTIMKYVCFEGFLAIK